MWRARDCYRIWTHVVLAYYQTGRNHGHQDGRYCETAVATCASTLKPSGGVFADTKSYGAVLLVSALEFMTSNGDSPLSYPYFL